MPIDESFAEPPAWEVAPKDRTALTGAAGAYYTAAVLAQHLWAPSLTVGNMPRTDIVAQHFVTERLIAVQCKASTARRSVQLSQTSEKPAQPGVEEWFVCSSVREGAHHRPRFYVIPRNVVAALVFVQHRRWLAGARADGEPRKDSSRRVLKWEEIDRYEERWDLLHHPTAEVPYWLPEWFREAAALFGLPEGHPGLPEAGDHAA